MLYVTKCTYYYQLPIICIGMGAAVLYRLYHTYQLPHTRAWGSRLKLFTNRQHPRIEIIIL